MTIFVKIDHMSDTENIENTENLPEQKPAETPAEQAPPEQEELMLFPAIKADVIVSRDGNVESAMLWDVFAKFFDDKKDTFIVMARDPANDKNVIQITFKK